LGRAGSQKELKREFHEGEESKGKRQALIREFVQVCKATTALRAGGSLAVGGEVKTKMKQKREKAHKLQETISITGPRD